MGNEAIDSRAWADEQLIGVMSRDDPRYHVASQLVQLIAVDCAMMLLHEQGVAHPHVASEYEPHSWAWVI
jgi:hypothetical protein